MIVVIGQKPNSGGELGQGVKIVNVTGQVTANDLLWATEGGVAGHLLEAFRVDGWDFMGIPVEVAGVGGNSGKYNYRFVARVYDNFSDADISNHARRVILGYTVGVVGRRYFPELTTPQVEAQGSTGGILSGAGNQNSGNQNSGNQNSGNQGNQNSGGTTDAILAYLQGQTSAAASSIVPDGLGTGTILGFSMGTLLLLGVGIVLLKR